MRSYAAGMQSDSGDRYSESSGLLDSSDAAFSKQRIALDISGPPDDGRPADLSLAAAQGGKPTGQAQHRHRTAGWRHISHTGRER